MAKRGLKHNCWSNSFIWKRDKKKDFPRNPPLVFGKKKSLLKKLFKTIFGKFKKTKPVFPTIDIFDTHIKPFLDSSVQIAFKRPAHISANLQYFDDGGYSRLKYGYAVAVNANSLDEVGKLIANNLNNIQNDIGIITYLNKGLAIPLIDNSYLAMTYIFLDKDPIDLFDLSNTPDLKTSICEQLIGSYDLYSLNEFEKNQYSDYRNNPVDLEVYGQNIQNLLLTRTQLIKWPIINKKHYEEEKKNGKKRT